MQDDPRMDEVFLRKLLDEEVALPAEQIDRIVVEWLRDVYGNRRSPVESSMPIAQGKTA